MGQKDELPGLLTNRGRGPRIGGTGTRTGWEGQGEAEKVSTVNWANIWGWGQRGRRIRRIPEEEGEIGVTEGEEKERD